MEFSSKKVLTGRLLEIATTGGGLDPMKVSIYRQHFIRLGYDVPEWSGSELPNAPEQPVIPYEPHDPRPSGVGGIIRTQLYRWGIKESDCTCRSLAKIMDDNGPEWCRQNIDHLSRKMATNAKTHKWMRFAPFKRLGTKKIIEMAIQRFEGFQERQRIINSIKWAVGMTTAPRKAPTIAQAVAGALLNDWRPIVFAEPESDLGGTEGVQVRLNERRRGIFWNWKAMSQSLLDEFPEATHILTMQDDCVLVKNARLMIERWIPDWPDNCGLVSLYLPSKRAIGRRGRRNPAGIHPAADHNFHGSLAVVWRRETLEKVLNHPVCERWGRRSRFAAAIDNDDICMGATLRQMRLKLYFAYPSCSQHVSPHSTRDIRFSATGVRAANWVATDAMIDCQPNAKND